MLILKVCISTQTHTQVWNHLNVFWCISFLLLLQQITTNLEALNHTNLLPYSSGGQKSTAAHKAASFLRFWGRISFLAFSSSISRQQSWAHGHIIYIQSQPHINFQGFFLFLFLCFQHHVVFSVCETLLPLSYKNPCGYKGLAWIIFLSQKSLT